MKTSSGTKRTVENQYLAAMPSMMENPDVWEIIKERSPEQKDSFLHDRFMSSCRRAFDAISTGATYDEWFDIATSAGIEPNLAQVVFENAADFNKMTLEERLQWLEEANRLLNGKKPCAIDERFKDLPE